MSEVAVGGIQIGEETMRWLVGGGVTAVVGLMTAMVHELRCLNGKMENLLIRESRREVEVQEINSVLEKLPCVRNGFRCEITDDRH